MSNSAMPKLDRSVGRGLNSDPLDGAVGAERSSMASSLDSVLGEVVEEITQRLQGGEDVDIDAFIERHPKLKVELCRLAPMLREMAQMAHPSDPLFDAGFTSGTMAEAGNEGRILDDFRVLRQVGRGGMGIVYEANQISLGRRVALKVLPLAAAMDPRALKRFQVEAQAAALLQHPRIVPVYAVGSIGDVPYYVMQFIDGASLAELVVEMRRLEGLTEGGSLYRRRSEGVSQLARQLLSGRFGPPDANELESQEGSPPTNNTASSTVPEPLLDGASKGRDYPRTVAALGVQAAEALDSAHGQAVVHRDVKPANLLLDRQGVLWVTDFGLARIPGDVGLTLSGDMMGTLRYMSPEQAEGRQTLVDRRTDIYALGATLYELLTLRPAVPGCARRDVVRQIVEEDPVSIRRLNPAVPGDLATVVAKAMNKNPADRYETAQLFADDLKRFLEGRSITARPTGPVERIWRWCRRRPLPAALVGCLFASLVAGIAGVAWSWREAVYQKNLLTQANTALRVASARERGSRKQAQLRFDLARDAVEQYYSVASEEMMPEQPQMMPLRNRLLGTALEFYRRLQATIEAQPQDLRSRADLAAVSRRIGQIAIDVGDRKSGLEALARSCSLLEQIVQENPRSEGVKAELASCLEQLGKLELYTTGREADGRRSLERALEIHEELLSQQPNDDRHPLAVAETIGAIGYERARQGQIYWGLRALQRERDMLERFATAHPANLDYQSRLARACSRLGHIQACAGLFAAAVASQRRAAEIFESLMSERPATHDFRRRFGQAITDLGRTHSNAGRVAEAITYLERGVSTLEALTTEVPSVPSYRRALAESLNVRGASFIKLRRQEEALESLTRARTLLDRLHADYPDFLPYQSDLAENALLTGSLLEDRRQFDSARNELALARNLLQRLPARAETLCNLARTESRFIELTSADMRDGQAGRAMVALRRAIEYGYRAAEQLRTEPDFIPLHSRRDFQLFLRDLASPDAPSLSITPADHRAVRRVKSQ